MELDGRDFSAVKGVGGRSAAAVPALVSAAFAPDAPPSGRTDAARSLRELLVGEGAFTAAGALAFPSLVARATSGAVARPEALWALLVDLVYGTEPFSPLGVPPGVARKKGAARQLHDALQAAVPALVAALGSPEPATRGGAGLLLGVARDADTASAVCAALGAETRADVRVALCFAVAGWAGTPECLRASLGAASAPERLAASLAAFVDQGDAAPEVALVQLGLWPDLEAPAPGCPLPAVLGQVATHTVLRSHCPRAIALVTEAALDRIDRALAQGGGSPAWNRALGELVALVACHVPPGAASATLSPLGRAVIERTLHPSFGVRPQFDAQGLPPSLRARRAWLGLDRAAELDADDALRVVLAFEAGFEDIPAVGGEPDACRAALDAVTPEVARRWAREHLARRVRFPGATLAPNGPVALLALERLDDAELERVWVRDHEPVLAALTAPDPARLALLARLPMPRRVVAWREHAAHPNPAVALNRALASAATCPMEAVARELLARALTVPAPPLAEVHRVLDALGPAGGAARSALRALDAWPGGAPTGDG